MQVEGNTVIFLLGLEAYRHQSRSMPGKDYIRTPLEFGYQHSEAVRGRE